MHLNDRLGQMIDYDDDDGDDDDCCILVLVRQRERNLRLIYGHHGDYVGLLIHTIDFLELYGFTVCVISLCMQSCVTKVLRYG